MTNIVWGQLKGKARTWGIDSHAEKNTLSHWLEQILITGGQRGPRACRDQPIRDCVPITASTGCLRFITSRLCVWQGASKTIGALFKTQGHDWMKGFRGVSPPLCVWHLRCSRSFLTFLLLTRRRISIDWESKRKKKKNQQPKIDVLTSTTLWNLFAKPRHSSPRHQWM